MTRTRPDHPHPVWTVEAVRDLGLTTTVDMAAAILGISRTKAYALAKEGDFPVRLIRVGRRYLVPVQPLLDLLTEEHRPTPRTSTGLTGEGATTRAAAPGVTG